MTMFTAPNNKVFNATADRVANDELDDSDSIDPIVFHLNACQTIAVERARSTFSNYLSDLEVAFNADLDNAKSSQGGFNSVLDKVLSDIQSDVKSITSTLMELNSFSQTITRRQATIERRASIMFEGKTRLRTVKIHVYEKLTKRTEGQDLPSTLLLFLFQPWTDYLCYSALRYGEESNAFNKALEVVDDIIWAIKPKFTQEEQSRHTQLKQTTLKEINTGFKTIRFDPSKSESMLASLASLMDTAIENAQPDPAPITVREALKRLAEEKAFKDIGTPTEPTDNEEQIIKLLRAVEFGTWFEFKNGKRLKVAWYNSRTSHYMLVDETGKKSDMMSGQYLARALLNKHAEIINTNANSKPILSRALESIFKTNKSPV